MSASSTFFTSACFSSPLSVPARIEWREARPSDSPGIRIFTRAACSRSEDYAVQTGSHRHVRHHTFRRLIQLRERLAENAHDLWAGQRMADGWTYGPHRDDAKRQNPCLVAYEDLPESEKQYDRLLAMETLKTIVALGFRILPD